MINYRGFIFVNLSNDGPGFEQALGPIKSAIDNLVDRSPEGAVELVPGIHKHVFPGNWKLLLENIMDAAHPPLFMHHPMKQVARDAWRNSVCVPRMSCREIIMPQACWDNPN